MNAQALYNLHCNIQLFIIIIN